MNLDDMKSAWQNADKRISDLEKQTRRMAQDISTTRRATALSALTARYTRFAWISLVMAPVWLTMAVSNRFFGDPTSDLLLGISGALYFCLASTFDFILAARTQRINLYDSTVESVFRQALGCRRFHLRCMMVLIPLAIILVAGIATANFNDLAMFTAICTGALAGTVIGIRFYLRFMNDYRILTRKD